MTEEKNERQPDITLNEIFRLPEANNLFDQEEVIEYKRIGDKFKSLRFRKVQAMSVYFNLAELQNLERIWEASDGEPYLYYDMLFQISPVDEERLNEAIEGARFIFGEDSTESLVNSYRIFTRAAKFLPFNSFLFDLERASPLRAFDEPGGYGRAYELDRNRPQSTGETEQRIWEGLDALNTFLQTDDSTIPEDALHRFFLVNSMSPHGWEFHSTKSRIRHSRQGFGFRKGTFDYPDAGIVTEYPELLAVLEFSEILMDVADLTNGKYLPKGDSVSGQIIETLHRLLPEDKSKKSRSEVKNRDSKTRMIRSINFYGLGNFIHNIVMSKARSFTKYLKFEDQEHKDHFLHRAELISHDIRAYLER